jgi:hypothetical protein
MSGGLYAGLSGSLRDRDHAVEIARRVIFQTTGTLRADEHVKSR